MSNSQADADGEVLYQIRADTSMIADDLENANSEVEKGTSRLKGIADNTAKAVGASFLAVGTSAVAIGTYAANSANDMDTAMNSFIASTGVAVDETERYQQVLENIYANNYGEDFQDIADSMAVVQQNIDGLSDEQLQSLTESAFALRDTFEYDVAESARAAQTLMENFGISGEEAMNLIASGTQNGLNYSGEFLDSINEYSVQFGKLGFSVDDMFSIFQQGADSGAWNLDKIGDAMKELSIRTIDGSDSTAEAFASIGLDANKMSAEFAKGGDAAKTAFQKTMTALSSIEDPLAKDAAGVALFGTMWEDLGPEVVESLANIEEGAYGTGDALETIKEVKYDDLGSMLEGLKRSVELLVVPLGEMLIPTLTELIEDVLPLLEEILPVIIEEFSGFLPPLLQIVQDILPFLLDLTAQLVPILTQTMNEILPILLDALNMLLPVIAQAVNELLPPLLDLFTQLMPVITELAVMLIPPLVEIFQALMPPLVEIIEALLPPLIELFNSLMPLIEALTPIIALLASALADNLIDAIDTVMPIINALLDLLVDVIEFIGDVFAGDWESAWDSIVEVFKGIFNLIPTVIESALNNAINLINGIIDGINDITEEIGISAIPTIDSVELPRFHTGGIIDFKGQYEAPILAKDGEMVLTDAQQKRLFDMASGVYTAPLSNISDNHAVNNNYYNETHNDITQNNSFSVRDDSDIERISAELENLQLRDDAAIGE